MLFHSETGPSSLIICAVGKVFKTYFLSIINNLKLLHGSKLRSTLCYIFSLYIFVVVPPILFRVFDFNPINTVIPMSFRNVTIPIV